MKQVPVREGVKLLLDNNIKNSGICCYCGKNAPWLTQCMQRYNTGYGDYIRHFTEPEVALLNTALRNMSKDLMDAIQYMPNNQKDDRQTFYDNMKSVMKIVHTAHLAEVAGVLHVRWSPLISMTSKYRLWFKPEQINRVKEEVKRIASWLDEMEFTYEPLDD